MDLKSTYAGIQLASPIVVGASPLALDLERVQDLASQGAGAIVMPSIFEEQITESKHRVPNGQFPESSDRNDGGAIPRSGPDLDNYNGGPNGYLHSIEKIKATVELPVIASISCASTGDWIGYADRIRDAGADAIELSAYHCEVDPHRFADEIVSTINKQKWTNLSDLIGSRHSGFDPFSEATLRREFSSAIASFPSAPEPRKDT